MRRTQKAPFYKDFFQLNVNPTLFSQFSNLIYQILSVQIFRKGLHEQEKWAQSKKEK